RYGWYPARQPGAAGKRAGRVLQPDRGDANEGVETAALLYRPDRDGADQRAGRQSAPLHARPGVRHSPESDPETGRHDLVCRAIISSPVQNTAPYDRYPS